MRVADRPLPSYTPTHAATFVDWPMSLHVLVEGVSTANRWDQPGITWDDQRVLWDVAQMVTDMVDLACDLAGLDITHGPPDDLALFPAGSVSLSLADPDGRYSRYNADGTLSGTQLGKRIGIILDTEGTNGFNAGEVCWLFYGRIASWIDTGTDMVEVTAFNLPNDMTQLGTYTPGTNGQTVAQRLAALMTVARVVNGLSRFSAGTVALTAQPTSQSPWEESQRVALSDGGIVFADADDALVYLNRDFRKGRTDQTRYLTMSDNDCDGADVIVWNAELSTNDEMLATSVLLTNVAGLVANKALSPNPYNSDSTFKHPDADQWSTQAEGDALAQWLLNKQSVPMVQVPTMQVMVDDARFDNLWPIAADTRIGDRMVFTHDYRPSGTLMVGGIVNHIAHSITPEQWVMTLGLWTYALEVGTVATAGMPGVWTDALGMPARPVATFADLGTVTAVPIAWVNDEYIILGDGTEVWHNAFGWHLGRAPMANPGMWGQGTWAQSTWLTLPAWDLGPWDGITWQ